MSCCGHDTSCPLCGKLIFCGPESDSLDAAWAEAEAALPEGWEIVGVSRLEYDEDQGENVVRAEWFADIRPGRFHGSGPTPAAALRSLAAKLRERAG